LKIFVGGDHRGVHFKNKIKDILNGIKIAVVDVGAFDETKSCDYPRIAYQVATQVVRSKNNRGILVCMSGIGQAIAANKVRGAYAALCYNADSARLSRQHNNANILVLGAKFTKKKDLSEIVQVWLMTPFEGGRHRRRVNQIKRIEKGEALG